MPNKKTRVLGDVRRAKAQPTIKQLNRSSKRKMWSEELMTAALDAVMKNGFSRNQAADTYSYVMVFLALH